MKTFKIALYCIFVTQQKHSLFSDLNNDTSFWQAVPYFLHLCDELFMAANPLWLEFFNKKKASLNYKAMQYPFQAHTLLKKKLLISIIVKIM